MTVLGIGSVSLAGTALAAGNYQTTDAVNVRQSAGTGGAVIKTEPKGASFYLNCQVQNSTNINGNGTWDNVKFTDGTVGYIADFYTTTPSFNNYAPGTGSCSSSPPPPAPAPTPTPPSGGPSGYTFCANEGQRCNFSGTADIAYGANGKLANKSGVTGGIDCNNGVFGDPNFGVAKACYQKASSNPAPGGPSGYTFCANEGQRCNFSGTADVAYGANGKFANKSGVTGGIDCNNGVFGDPNFGVAKACYQKASSSPAPTPGGVRLSVPFATQMGSAGDPNTGSNNCGPVSVTMAIRFYGGSASVGESAVAIRGTNTTSNGPTDFKSAQTISWLGRYGLTLRNVSSYDGVRNEVAAGHPVIILVNNNQYRYVSPQPYPNNNNGWFTANHIVVVTGYDSNNVYINDPLRSSSNYAVPVSTFQSAASSTSSSTSSNWYAASVLRK